MSLLDALTTPIAPPEPKSKIAAILLAVTPEEQTALETVLRDATWTHERLAETLTASGHPVAEASVRRYRKGLK